MFYDRKIKYLELYEKGVRLQGAGFVKLEVRDDQVGIQIKAEKLRYTDNMVTQVTLVGEDKEGVLGELVLETGKGSLECGGLDYENMVDGIGYDDLEEIVIKIYADRFLRCRIREKKVQAAQLVREEAVQQSEQQQNLMPMQQPELQQSPVRQSEPRNTTMFTKQEETLEENRSGQAEKPLALQMSREESVTRQEKIPGEESAMRQEAMPNEMLFGTIPQPELAREQEMRRAQPPSMRVVQGMQNQRPQASTKWQQISNMYPHIKPFGDEREYLQLKPEDFVILGKAYYSLASNSFLLHGYYNYDHLILSRQFVQDSERYYIGVPGNFYAKEKQVAVLYGFESFEGKTEPARNGDFGYYMISVEI